MNNKALIVFVVLFAIVIAFKMNEKSSGGGSSSFNIESLDDNFYANEQNFQDEPTLTILSFWATWCGACKQSIPIYNELYDDYYDEGLEIIGFSKENLSTLKDFNYSANLEYPLYHDVGGLAMNRYAIKAYPTTIIVDSDGDVLERFIGGKSKENLDGIIRKYLK